MNELMPNSGNYKKLLSYRKADVIYQMTCYFCSHFLTRGDRTVDQMVQAARSGKQNIVEGCAASATSAKTEIKLVNVAKASLKELLEDYEDYLKVHGHPQWAEGSAEYEAMRRREKPETSAQVRQRVNAARDIQKRRFAGTAVSCNAYMTPAMIGEYCLLDQAGERLMKGAFDRLGLTGRSHDRILRMARTIADLDGSERIEAAHLAEAIQYRSSNLLK